MWLIAQFKRGHNVKYNISSGLDFATCVFADEEAFVLLRA